MSAAAVSAPPDSGTGSGSGTGSAMLSAVADGAATSACRPPGRRGRRAAANGVFLRSLRTGRTPEVPRASAAAGSWASGM
eukprot:588638-Lingulodinium_polyedra.AAC.1